MKQLTVLGSTGSIGRSTLQVVRESGGAIRVAALTAGRNTQLLAEQALEFRPDFISLADEETRDRFWTALRGAPGTAGYSPEVACGPQGNVGAVISVPSDVVMSAAVGVAGLEATFEAVRRGKRVALANKEVLISAGELVMREAARSGAELLPVDSEHNGVHQCLRAGRRDEVERIILTASGGPFRQTPLQEMERVTPEQALNHPTWRMGERITIDSATLMNKGFEVIEACWLFGFAADEVEVVIHPQSIVHALVEFRDGSVVAQLAPPDMKLPIRYALSYPLREMGARDRRLRWDCVRQLDFEPPDLGRFPLLGCAYQALRAGGGASCVLNAADEVAVQAFLDSKIAFTAIPAVVQSTLDQVAGRTVGSISEVLELDQEARLAARKVIERKEHSVTAAS
jgi:1-deoxy-D-xylulose-5-phosphate reductoisomerase